MKQLRIAFLVGAVFCVAPAALVAQASSFVDRFETDYDSMVENPCNGEVVHITGTVVSTRRWTVDANGIVHVAYNFVPHVSGEGSTGAYKVVGGDRSSDKFIDGQLLFPENYKFSSEFNIISQGKAPNFISTVSGHYILLDDGTVRLEFFHSQEKCTGR
jgi:hypothetical protein